MRALKTIVIGLGATLVAGFGLLVFGLTQNWHRLTDGPTPTATRNWGTAALNLPAQSRVQSVTASGNLVVIHVQGQAGDERLMVLDPTRGTLIGTFAVTQP